MVGTPFLERLRKKCCTAQRSPEYGFMLHLRQGFFAVQQNFDG
jgi:hypothetical protein